MKSIRLTLAPLLLTTLLTTLLGGCSGEHEVAEGGHVWKGQTQALEKAKEVEQLLQQTTDRQRIEIDQLGR